MVAFGFLAEPVEDDARLDTRSFCLRIEINQLIQIFREIENHRDIAALARETRSAAARE